MINEEIMIEDLLKGDCSLERSLIIASGVRSEEGVSGYLEKLDLIQQRYHDKIERKGTNKEKAQWLFDYMCGMTHRRYNDSSLLTNAIDSKLDLERKFVRGDCTSLTALYSVLLLSKQ
mgnify:FL=1